MKTCENKYTIQLLGDNSHNEPEYLYDKGSNQPYIFADNYMHWDREFFNSAEVAENTFKRMVENKTILDRCKVTNWWNPEEVKFHIVKCKLEKVIRLDKALKLVEDENFAFKPLENDFNYFIAKFIEVDSSVKDKIMELGPDLPEETYKALIDSTLQFKGYLNRCFSSIDWGGVCGHMYHKYSNNLNILVDWFQRGKQNLLENPDSIGFDYEKEQYGQDKDWWVVKENMIVIPNDFVDTFDFATFKKENEV